MSDLTTEWVSLQNRTWIQTAKKVMSKVLKVPNIKTWFGVAVPNSQWSEGLTQSYNQFIFHKQNLGSIEKALAGGLYAHPVAWENAVRTVFRNAFVFNKPGTDGVLEIAAAGSEVFESNIAKLKEGRMP